MDPQTWKTFEGINRSRRAVKYFTNDSVSDEDMHAILSAAQLAPSSFNLQPYEFHWVKDKMVCDEMRKACKDQRAAASAATFVVIIASWKKLRKNYQLMIDYTETSGLYDEKAKEFYREKKSGIYFLTRPVFHLIFGLLKPVFVLFSKHLVLIPVGRSGLHHWTTRSSIYAAQTLMLAAQARGVNSCPMEGFSPFKVAKILKIKNGVIPLVIALGKKDESKELTPHWRVPFNEAVVVH